MGYWFDRKYNGQRKEDKRQTMVKKKKKKKKKKNHSGQKSRDTRHDPLVQNPLINHERGKDEIVTSINGRNTCIWSSVTHVKILPNGYSNHDGKRKTFKLVTLT